MAVNKLLPFALVWSVRTHLFAYQLETCESIDNGSYLLGQVGIVSALTLFAHFWMFVGCQWQLATLSDRTFCPTYTSSLGLDFRRRNWWTVISVLKPSRCTLGNKNHPTNCLSKKLFVSWLLLFLLVNCKSGQLSTEERTQIFCCSKSVRCRLRFGWKVYFVSLGWESRICLSFFVCP